LTISSLSQANSYLTNNSSSITSERTSSSITSSNFGDQLISTLNTLPTVSQQNLVSLNSQSTTPNNQTYNAQGLLQQIQSNILSNDQLLMSDTSTNASSSLSDSLLQGLLSPPQTSTATNALKLNSTGSKELKQNPSMAPTLIQKQINQSLMSLFNQ
jgi:hypothetical protein